MKKIIISIVLLAGVLVASFLFLRKDMEAPVPQAGPQATYLNADPDMIEVSVTPGQTVSNPLVLSGRARGYWYFEASFPVRLVDQSGAVLTEVPAQAIGDWMTEDFVPFSVTLSYPTQPSGSQGFLILRNDNPSGEPERDRSVTLPVIF
jgi:hypothetical protein